MIWPDRVAIVIAGLLWLLMFGLASGHGQPGAAGSFEVIKAVLLLTAIPWLILRGLYFIFRGR